MIAVWGAAQIPVLGMPFLFLSTWVHELGHGLGAILTGGHFAHMRLSPDFGGVAHTSTTGGFSTMIVLLGGLLGPSIAGAFLLILSRGFNQNRLALFLLVGALTITIIFWSANNFTRFTLLGINVVFILIALRAPPLLRSVFSHIVAIAFCLSAVTRFDYFFAGEAIVGGSSGQSDTDVLTEIVGGTHLIWGVALSALALFILYSAFRIAGRLAQKRRPLN